MGNCVNKCSADYNEEFVFEDLAIDWNELINGDSEQFEKKY